MIKAYQNISVHYRTPDIRFLAVFSVRNGDRNVVSTAQPVCYYYLASGRYGIKPVEIGAVEMFKSMLSRSRIQSITIRKKGHSISFLDNIRNSLGIVGTKIGKIAQFAKMHLYRHKLTVHIDSSDTCHPY